MMSNKGIFISIIITIILIVIMNSISSKTFFGMYYVNIYVLTPLLLVQLSTLLFYKKYNSLARIISILIALIMVFIMYKFIRNG